MEGDQINDLVVTIQGLPEQSNVTFQGVAENTIIDGFKLVSVNGDGVMLSVDNGGLSPVNLKIGSTYKITISEV
jgi:hypothetical protein